MLLQVDLATATLGSCDVFDGLHLLLNYWNFGTY
jgi:hypothetical protein